MVKIGRNGRILAQKSFIRVEKLQFDLGIRYWSKNWLEICENDRSKSKKRVKNIDFDRQ